MFDEKELTLELAEFYQIPYDEAHHYLMHGNEYYREEWIRSLHIPAELRVNLWKYTNIQQPPTTPEQIKEFYKKSYFAAFDMAKWHRNDNIIEFRGRPRSYYERYAYEAMNYFEHHPITRIFNYGGGIGSMDIRLAEMHHNVTSFDIGEKTQGFAKFRANKRGLNIQFINELPIGNIQYPNLICYDVLEHCSNMDKELQNISNLLEKGGHAFIQVTFPRNEAELRENPSHLEIHMGKNIRDLIIYLKKYGLEPLQSHGHFVKL